MLFVAYWKINLNLEPQKIAEASAKLLEKVEFPVKGIKTLGWYIEVCSANLSYLNHVMCVRSFCDVVYMVFSDSPLFLSLRSVDIISP